MGRSRHSALRSPRSWTVWLLWLGVAAGLWVAFVDSTQGQEMLLGAVSVLATVAFTSFVSRTTGTELSLRLRDVAQGWRIPMYIASGVWEILVVLARDLLHIQEPENRFRVCGFDSSRHDPVRMGRTTLAVAYTTAAPNFIVIGIDPSQSRMLFHQISATGVQRMARNLGAKG